MTATRIDPLIQTIADATSVPARYLGAFSALVERPLLRLTADERILLHRARLRELPDGIAFGTEPVPVHLIVRAVRKHLSTARTMRRNIRLGHYEGRNDGGGGAAVHMESAETLLRLLLDLPGATGAGSWQRRMYGRVWGEHDLSERLSEARDNGQARPELADRQRRGRRELRDLLQEHG